MKVTVFLRKDQGTGRSRQLRKIGQTPGIIYGGANDTPVNIKLDHNMLYYALKNEMFHSSILDLELNGVIEQVLLRDVQIHAYKQLILHVDFQRINALKKIHVKVPLHFINGEISPAIKLSSGVISHVLSELDIVCLPKNLPNFVEVDLSNLEIGHSIHLIDLKLPYGVNAIGQENLTIATAILPIEKTEIENKITDTENEEK